MVVLADPLLEAFFDVDLPRSFQLLPVNDSGLQRSQPGLGLLGNVGDFLSSFVTDDNKKIFNSFVDDMGKAIGKHQVRSCMFWAIISKSAPQVTVRPSINQHERNLALQEPLRETTRYLQRSKPQGASVPGGNSGSSIASQSPTSSSTSKPPIVPPSTPQKQLLSPSPHTDDVSPLARANAAAAAVMERQAFAIDEAKDDDDLGEGETGEVGGEDDDRMMDEVDAFLEAHGK